MDDPSQPREQAISPQHRLPSAISTSDEHSNMKPSTAFVLAAATAEASILSRSMASVSSHSSAALGTSIAESSSSIVPGPRPSSDASPTTEQSDVVTSSPEAYPHLLDAPAEPKSEPGFAKGTEWMKGHSMLVISMVFSGRLAITDIPPPGQDHLIYPQFEDVVLGDVMADEFGGGEATYHDVYGNVKTKQDWETYRENEKSMPKPHCGQVLFPCMKDSQCGSVLSSGRRSG